jgi:hypothetical protein
MLRKSIRMRSVRLRVGWGYEIMGLLIYSIDAETREGFMAWKWHPAAFESPSLWVARNINIRDRIAVRQLAGEVLSKADIALFQHPYYENIDQELWGCVQAKKVTPIEEARMKRAIIDYHKQGFKSIRESYFVPHSMTGVMFRKHTWEILELGRQVYAEMEKYGVWRDQLVFPYVCWKLGVTPQVIPKAEFAKYFWITGTEK